MPDTFAEVLETIEKFTVDEKETLVDILQNRLRETKRRRIVQSVRESRREFERGNLILASVDDIMKEVSS